MEQQLVEPDAETGRQRARAFHPPPLEEYRELPRKLLLALALICVLSFFYAPAGMESWLLEVGPGLVPVVGMAATFDRFQFSHVVYVCWFVHILILIYGGMYTYADTPLGNWAKDAFNLSRNHYDRVGHFALGFCPAPTIREVYIRFTGMTRGGFLFFTVCSVALAIGAFWELLEWWTTLLVASDVGEAFLGSQGDVWDAQW